MQFFFLMLFFSLFEVKPSLESMFKSLGGGVNVTSAGSYEDQSAGYYSAGGVSIRTKNNTVNPINVSLPEIRAGCGGIDAYMGSFSFLSGDKLLKLMKSLGQKAPVYAFQLGLKTMAPQIEGLMSQLQKIAMEMNNFMIEDCRIVESAFAAALPKESAMGRHACADVMQHSGQTDWFKAKEDCQSFAKQKEMQDTVKQKSPDQLVGDYNLVWKAAKKAKIFSAEAEQIMTLVGTVISREETPPSGGEGIYRTFFIDAAGDRSEQLDGYLKGGKVDQYACDSKDNCLKPTRREINITEKDSLLGRTRSMVNSMRDRYQARQAFSKEQESFLNVVGEKVPIYKYIQISTAAGAFFLDEIVEYVALYVLFSNVDQITSQVTGWIETLQSVQMADLDLEKFKNNLMMLRTHLITRMGSLDHKVWVYMKKAQTIEASIIARKIV